MEFAIETLGCIYISDYVYEHEIKKDTPSGKILEKLKNSQIVKILEYGKLTGAQQQVYRKTYKLLKQEEISFLEWRHNDRFVSLMNQYFPKWSFYKEELNCLPVKHEEWE